MPLREREDGEEAGNGIRAMLVGLSMLQAIAKERRPLPLKDVATVSGLSPSRAHRYLSSLLAAGFMEQDVRSGHYALGQAVVELGLVALGQLDHIRIGVDALVAFSEETGFDGHLSVWGSFGPTVVRWQSGRLGYHFRIDEGRVLPLLWSATGRVLMAYREGGEIAPLVKQELAVWNRENPEQQIRRQDVTRMCAAVREFGLSASVPSQQRNGLLDPVFPTVIRLGLETTAAPIFDHRGRVPMALTFLGQSMVRPSIANLHFKRSPRRRASSFAAPGRPSRAANLGALVSQEPAVGRMLWKSNHWLAARHAAPQRPHSVMEANGRRRGEAERRWRARSFTPLPSETWPRATVRSPFRGRSPYRHASPDLPCFTSEYSVLRCAIRVKIALFQRLQNSILF